MRERLLLWVLALGFQACSTHEQGPKLIELRELSPRHVEAGDRVRLLGSGFPDGQMAEVTLRGELRRAGEVAVPGVKITAQAELVSPHGVELPLSPELVGELCGKADARHTTFRGDVAISFPARTAKGSPVEGVLEGVVFDVTPDTTSKTTLSSLEREGVRFASFLGAKVQQADVGLVVSEVLEGSRAARAGLLQGDRLIELDSAIVRELRDWVPAPNTQVASLRVDRGGEKVLLRLETAGFRYHSPNVLSGAVLVLGLVLVPLLCWWSSLGRLLAFIERTAQSRLRLRLPEQTVVSARPRLRELLSALLDRLPASLPPYLGLLVTSALFTALSLGKTLVGSDLDLFLVPAAVSAGLVVAAFACGGGSVPWSFKLGGQRALGAFAVTLPPLLALFTRAAAEDTHELRRLVVTQGVFPWQWAAFSSPAELLAAVSALAALVPSVAPAVSRARRRAPATARLLELTEWCHKLVLVGALAVTFFGGWRVPGSPDSVLGAALGALSLLVKSWLLLGGVVFVRWALGSIDVVVNLGGAFSRLALPSSICVFLALGWRAVVSNPAFVPVELASGKILFALCAGLVLLMIQRVSSGLRREAPTFGVQFWL